MQSREWRIFTSRIDLCGLAKFASYRGRNGACWFVSENFISVCQTTYIFDYFSEEKATEQEGQAERVQQ